VWVGLFAPAGVNPEIAKTIQAAMTKVMARPDVRERLTLQGLDLTPVNTNKLAGFLKDEIAKWARIVKTSGAQLD
jgi:tripartite-type tricarboxylate transporter receptor subunit TctC